MPRRGQAQAYGVPRVKGQTGFADVGGRELRPLAGVEIDLPPTAEEGLQAEYEAWNFKAAGMLKMSLIEFIAFKWLTQKKKLKMNQDFQFRVPFLGARTQFGAFEVDFYFPLQRMAWLVQGLQFHRVKREDRARDTLAKAVLSGHGLLVVELFEDDLLQRPEYTLVRAFNGQQVSRRSP